MNRTLTAPLTLAAAGLAVLVMALWGFNSFTAPFENDSASGDGSCEAPTASHRVKRSDITVSVYNAGERQGRAGATLDLLEEAGFQPGAIGNAPKAVRIQVAVVHTTKEVHPDATLVARALGKNVQVVVVEQDLGPGIDVIIGDRFKRLNPDAPKSVRLPGSAGTC